MGNSAIHYRRTRRMIAETDRAVIDNVSAFQDSIRAHIKYTLGKGWEKLHARDAFLGVALAIRDCLIDRLIETERRYELSDAKRLYYLSMEFLMGRLLGNNLISLGLLDLCRDTLQQMGFDLEEIREKEPDAALGNGGLGRLAACFLDSLATLDMPGFGYGINYEYGLFKQEIENGYQKEKPDHWLEYGSPWQIRRADEVCIIPVYGHIEHAGDRANDYNPMWMDWKILIGVPHDMPIVGHGGSTVNFLRLYSARSSHEFDMDIFNQGDYIKAVEMKISTETISKVLYPSDSIEKGRELRLLQEYFLVACAMRDIISRYMRNHHGFDQFADRVAVQLNDTHPALAVAELMRVLVDENDLPWERAWDMTVATLAFTNHTLMPEALEKWPIKLLERVLPRHVQIIREIERRFLDQIELRWPGDEERKKRMSLIETGESPQVRMGHLAIVGSHSINGVAKLHSELVKTTLVPDFYEMWPERFNNKTNGVTQRRWLLKANPGLARLITRATGEGWIKDLDQLRALESHANDAAFQEDFRRVKRANKERLARVIQQTAHIVVDPDSLFDVQIKRMHEYKRQLLNVMHIIHEYLRFIEDGQAVEVPRAYIFAGKAAPGYLIAKQIIKLINNVSRVINRDRRIQGLIKVAFIPDYRVSLAEKIIPAADLSEQISTAGKEASGTGNMKFAMNGALTIGTLDGANIEIREEVGEENIFIFGLKAHEIQQMIADGSYNPREHYENNPYVKRVMDAFNSNLFCAEEPELFEWIYNILIERDQYFLLADLPSYIEAQLEVGREFKNPQSWTRKAVLNVARVGKFSSDRTIKEYASEIWDIKPV